MARPKCCRIIAGKPNQSVFKPAGVPNTELKEIVLDIDEFEAFRLADHEGFYHEAAATEMGVSRQTFGRILEAARRKIASAIVEGCALRIEEGAAKWTSRPGRPCCENRREIQSRTAQSLDLDKEPPG
jgi:uncharacterized protein